MAQVQGKDAVGAKMDCMELEREKALPSSPPRRLQLQLRLWQEEEQHHAINIIDTPGKANSTI